MDAKTVADRLDQLQLVDVRYPSEWLVGHVDGAVNLPEEDIADRVDELDRDRPVITVCRAGTRSAEAAEWLRGEGFDAQSLDGGMLAWKWAGLPIAGKGFLRERMIGEGRTPEEADAFLVEMDRE
jgi:rhodanese-related sulfurtransferase